MDSKYRSSPAPRKVVQVSVEGLPAAGKGRFTDLLCRGLTSLGLPAVCVEEPVDKWKLAECYADPVTHALEFQRTVVRTRLEAFLEAMEAHPEAVVVVLDRSIAGDKLFARARHRAGQITDEGMALYEAEWEAARLEFEARASRNIPVFLATTPEVAMVRKFERNRPGEEYITLEYQQELFRRHVEDLPAFFSEPTIEIDGNAFFAHFEDLVPLIQPHLFPLVASALPPCLIDEEKLRSENPALYGAWWRRSIDGF